MIDPTLRKKNIIMFDGIAFHGGSKVATQNIVTQLSEQGFTIHVLTRDPESWKGSNTIPHGFTEFGYLAAQENGLAFYFKHLWISLFLFALVMRCGRGTSLMGTSGPGIDLAVYFVGYCCALPIIQFVHGPVAASRTIGRCLMIANLIIYLPSAMDSITIALKNLLSPSALKKELSRSAYIIMKNGIAEENWPSPSTSDFTKPHVFWAASLLRWKGVSILSGALSRFDQHQVPHTTLCYINPKSTRHEISRLPLHIFRLHKRENPENLDDLRSLCNIFVSTAHKEPFGLSILEAMAAGLCIVIPNDGAYWDTVLVDGESCIKYRPGDSVDLYTKLHFLEMNIDKAKHLATASQAIAAEYKAAETYKPVISSITHMIKHPNVARRHFHSGRVEKNHANRKQKAGMQ